MNYYTRPVPHSKPLAFWKAILIFFLLFGNNEDGFWGDSNWNPERKKDLKTAWNWWTRNPFHNLFFHAIGFTDKRTEMWGKYVPSIANPFNEGWNKHLVRPIGFSWQRLLLSSLYLGTSAFLYFFLDFQFWPWLFYIPGVLMFLASFKLFMFPFVSYTSDVTVVKDAYAGWRPSGAFGFKFQLNREVAQAKYPKTYKVFGKFLT